MASSSSSSIRHFGCSCGIAATASEGKLVDYRLSRRKLGLGPDALGEFHIVVETRNLAQLDEAFKQVSERAEPVESLHAAVNQSATDLTFALYRDFPDSHRKRGEEKF